MPRCVPATFAVVVVCLLSIVPTTLAAPPGASLQGKDLVVTGKPGTRIAVLSPAEKTLGKGVIPQSGTLVLAGLGDRDPMQRLVDVDGRRGTLSDLFPKAELVAIFPKTAGAGLPIHPQVRAVKRGSSKPFAGLQVALSLECGRQPNVSPLGTVTTDANGVGRPGTKGLVIPAEATGSCQMVARGAGARVAQKVQLTAGSSLVVSTDRPVYQPGHRIAARGLVLDANTGTPRAKQAAMLELRNSRGRPVVRRRVTTSPFGLAHADLVVPKNYRDEVAIVRVSSGPTFTQKKVKVGRYVTPRVSVRLTPETEDLKPNAILEVQAKVSRLDGGPVQGTPVEFKVWDAGRALATVKATADVDGFASLGHRLGSVASDQVSVSARAEVSGGDVGTARLSLNVDRGQLLVFAIPESGSLVPGLHNGMWVVTQRPDGAPVSAKVKVQQGHGSTVAQTDADGMGYVRFKVARSARSVTVVATSGRRVARRSLRVKRPSARDGGLLHIDRTVVAPGAKVAVRYATVNGKGLATFDVVQGGHPVASLSAPLVNGVASTAITLPRAAAGTIAIHAWHLDRRHRAVGDTRLLLAQDQRDLEVSLTPDRDSYRPRDEATVRIKVVDGSGRPVVAALDLTAVDAGFRALGLEQPGLEQAFARLSDAWNKTAAPVPDWAREALYLNRDAKRLAIMAAAAETVTAMNDAAATEQPRLAASMDAFREPMEKRVRRIAKGLTRYYKRRSHKDKPTRAARLVRGKYVRAADFRDPWGRAVRMKLVTDSGCGDYLVRVGSNGMDGKRGTADDLTVEAYFENYSRTVRVCMRSRGMFGVGAGGGGGFAGGRMQGGMGRAIRKPTVFRKEFPETLAVTRNIITNADGTASWTVPLADSLTTWVVQGRAVSRAGGLGGAEAELNVRQPFSVDVSLPAALTMGDVIMLPIGVTNTSPKERQVVLTVRTSGTLKGAMATTLTVPPNVTRTAHVTVTALSVGDGKLEVEAVSGAMSDGVRRTLRVEPDGVPVHDVQNGTLSAGDKALLGVLVPPGGIDGTYDVEFRVYPSDFSAVIEGLDALLRHPSGCFEQTSSTTYPNALVLQYLERTRQDKPKVAAKARAFLKAGWKRLMSYEVQGGGFSWFGNAPANQVLTAYGLMEFEQIARVMKVDRTVIDRTRRWLLAKRKADGSFAPDASHLHDWSKIQANALPVTAYLTWALARSGASARDLAPSLRWLREHQAAADTGYVKALVALALTSAAPRHASAKRARRTLDAAGASGDEGTHWTAGMSTGTHARGVWADMETTGLAVLALAGNGAPAQAGLKWLLGKRGTGGGWGTTQATVLALEGLLTVGQRRQARGTLTVADSGQPPRRERFTADDADVMRSIALSPKPGKRNVEVALVGKGGFSYQLEATRYVPTALAPKVKGPLALKVTPNKTSVAVGEPVLMAVDLDAHEKVRMPTLQIGLPAGFELQEDSIRGAGIQKHEVLGRTLVLYLTELVPGQPLKASYQLVARRVGHVSPGAAKAWPYYEPDKRVYAAQPKLRTRQP